MDEENEENVTITEERDDKRTGTPPLLSGVAFLFELTAPEYSWFHIIFAMTSMYVAKLLVDWKTLRTTPDMEAGDDPDYETYIGRSEMAMWMLSYRVGSASGCTDGAWSRLSRCLTGLVTRSKRAGLSWCRYSL